MSAGPSFLRGFWSLAQVAEHLSVDRSTVSRWVQLWQRTGGREGLGPVVRLGRRCVRIDRQTVEVWLELMSDPKGKRSAGAASKMDRAGGTPGAKGRELAGSGDQAIGLGNGSCDVVSTGCAVQVVGGQESGAACGGLRGGGAVDGVKAGGGSGVDGAGGDRRAMRR